MLDEMKKLISELLKYNHYYYNENTALISDYEYDLLFDKLKQMEAETGIVLSNSPTNNVGATVVDYLEKVTHNHPMLSLDKTKDYKEIEKFIGNKECLAMLKMDGLTISVKYINGILTSAETRGNGIIGENVLHTVKLISNIPAMIPYKDEAVVVDGEAIIDLKTFEKINKEYEIELREQGKAKGLSGELLEEYIKERLYKNSRNLAAGSIRRLNGEIIEKRKVQFIAWKSITGIKNDSFSERLDILKSWGFETVPYIKADKTKVQDHIEYLKERAALNNYPIDGLVFSYDGVAYGESLGFTGHHIKSQMAFKFYDDEQETILNKIEWSIGRTGVITPIAVFEPIEVDGTTVEKASLHNVSIFKSLELGKGDRILVYKANQIIPQVSDNLTKSNCEVIPDKCPVCGRETKIIKDNTSEILVCDNVNCSGKQLNKICNFVSKAGMDITGLSKKTIEKLLDVGYITDYYSIFKLHEHKIKLLTLEGFGKKKVENLLKEIEQSKNVSLSNFLCALGIEGLGKSKCLQIEKQFTNFEKFRKALENHYNFEQLEDFGPAINFSIYNYWMQNEKDICKLAAIMNWKTVMQENDGNKFDGLTFVITGELTTFKNREELKSYIVNNGGKVANSVTGKTNYLINNDTTSNSSKNKKAKELGIPILSESDFLKM